MKLLYVLVWNAFVGGSILYGMEQNDIEEELTIVDLIERTEGKVQKKIEEHGNGTKIYCYFLMVRNDDGISEFYFSRKRPKRGKSKWYGKVTFTIGKFRPINNSTMYNYIIDDIKAKPGYKALREKYKKQNEAVKQQKERA